MELKYKKDKGKSYLLDWFNRTFMELKWPCAAPLRSRHPV